MKSKRKRIFLYNRKFEQIFAFIMFEDYCYYYYCCLSSVFTGETFASMREKERRIYSKVLFSENFPCNCKGKLHFFGLLPDNGILTLLKVNWSVKITLNWIFEMFLKGLLGIFCSEEKIDFLNQAIWLRELNDAWVGCAT